MAINETFSDTGTGTQEANLDRFSVSVSGGSLGTVVLERKLNGTWRTVETFTSASEKIATAGAWLPHRFNCTVYDTGPADPINVTCVESTKIN